MTSKTISSTVIILLHFVFSSEIPKERSQFTSSDGSICRIDVTQFDNAQLLGHGNGGCVFLAPLREGGYMAVKVTSIEDISLNKKLLII